MKKTILFFFVPVMCMALGTYVLQNGVWYNTTTGKTFYASSPSTYPPGVNTFTPTPTVTNTYTYTPTPTATPTSTPFVYNANSGVTYNGPYANGFGPTYTPVAAQATQGIPNFVLIGKSLGTGNAEATTVSSNVATVTHTSHGYAQNDLIVMTGTGTGGNSFNALYVIQSVTTNTYTVNFTASDGPVTNATEMFWFSGANSLNPTKCKNLTRSSTGQYVGTWLNTQSGTNYGISIPAVGDSAASPTLVAQPYSSSTSITTTTFPIYIHGVDNTSYDALSYMMILGYQIQ